MKAKVVKTGEIVEVYHEPQHGQTTNIYKECVLVNGRMWPEDELNFHVKANEAPYKIYLNQDDGLIWHCRSYKDDIEYTRTDAFFEKVEEFLYEKLNSGDMECGDIVTFISDFKKHLKC